MKIYKYDVANDLIFQYCKIITLLEKKFDSSLEYKRGELHNQIFESVNCHRSLYRQDDRNFNTALNKVVIDLTESGD